MSVEILGMIATQHKSEIHPGADLPTVDPDYVARFARAFENSGFDRVLVGYSSGTPDGFQVAAHAAAHTERLGFLIAHRPGFVFPTVAARTYATLDQFTQGRVALHTISGAADAEQARDGDHTTKAQRYARSREFLQIIKQAWTSDEPFGYDGEFYKFEDFVSGVKPVDRIPVYFGGSSPAAYEVGGAEADVFMFFAQPVEQLTEEFAAVRAAAAAAGRTTGPRFSVSFRPILGATEELAWQRARDILERTNQNIALGARSNEFRPVGDAPRSAGSQRQLDAAASGSRHGAALWTELAAATGAGGNSTALVGTPETVADALLEYVDAGAEHLLIRGYDPYDDAIDYGRELLPRVRAGVAARERRLAG